MTPMFPAGAEEVQISKRSLLCHIILYRSLRTANHRHFYYMMSRGTRSQNIAAKIEASIQQGLDVLQKLLGNCIGSVNWPQ